MDTVADLEILSKGDLEISGRLVDASNATLFGTLTVDEVTMNCIYKPIAGERPLWDFPDGQLAHREYAAYLVSEFLGFEIVPPTVLRDGPYGLGMVQKWIDIDEDIDLAEYFSRDDSQLRKMALFDALINNTDRKIGHLLPDKNGHLFGCDHGVTFHTEDKLRTVLWQWAGNQFNTQELEILTYLIDSFAELKVRLVSYLTIEEIHTLELRAHQLLQEKRFPLPNPNWPSIPWPAF
jgi:hypothetical protein